MKIVYDILNQKGREVWSVTPETTVYDALSLMADKDIGALLVEDEGKLAGIFSERDYARKVILQGKSSRMVPVKEIMTTTVYHVKPVTTIEECMALMTELKIRHLPVLSGEKMDGVISIGDVVKALMTDKDFTIEQLEKYITTPR